MIEGNRLLMVQIGSDLKDAKVFPAFLPPQKPCEDLNNAVKLLAKMQTEADSMMSKAVEGLHERSPYRKWRAKHWFESAI